MTRCTNKLSFALPGTTTLPESPPRRMFIGESSCSPAGAPAPWWQPTQFVVKIDVLQVFPNCPRYVHKVQPVDRSEFVPRADTPTPVPRWKQMEWARDVLPAGDPSLQPPSASALPGSGRP